MYTLNHEWKSVDDIFSECKEKAPEGFLERIKHAIRMESLKKRIAQDLSWAAAYGRIEQRVVEEERKGLFGTYELPKAQYRNP